MPLNLSMLDNRARLTTIEYIVYCIISHHLSRMGATMLTRNIPSDYQYRNTTHPTRKVMIAVCLFQYHVFDRAHVYRTFLFHMSGHERALVFLHFTCLDTSARLFFSPLKYLTMNIRLLCPAVRMLTTSLRPSFSTAHV